MMVLKTANYCRGCWLWINENEALPDLTGRGWCDECGHETDEVFEEIS